MRDDDDNNIDWVLLGKYFSRHATAAEQAAVEHWMADDPARRRHVEAMRRIWARTGELTERVGPVDTRAAWRAVQPRPEPAHRGGDVPLRRRVLRSTWLRAAAAVVVAAGGAWLARDDLAAWMHREPAPLPPTHEIVTARGQRAELRLDDGSRVVLGAQSTLRWSVRPGARRRDVYLEGEALFEVTHDARRPFRVHAGRVIAEDLGTLFVVHAYPTEPRVTVAVKEGEVALTTPRAPATHRSVLRGGDLGVVIADSGARVRHGADIDPYLAFARGQLAFAAVPIRDVVPELERWYDIQLTLADPALATARVTATFDQDDLETALRYLANSLDARVERHGRRIVVHAN